MIRRLVLSLALACAVLGCGGQQRTAHVVIVTTGAALASLHAAHAEAYAAATNDLIGALAADGGRVDDYDRAVAPMDREFEARSQALVSLDAALYAAASINDAARNGAPAGATRDAARRVLEAVMRAMDVLQSGNVLSPVRIPPEVRAIVVTLTDYLRGGIDAGR